MSLAQVWTSYPTSFSFQFSFDNLIEFSMTKAYSKFCISYILGLKTFQITFLKSYSLKALQDYQKRIQNPLYVLVLI
jgi:hypothetical protein